MRAESSGSPFGEYLQLFVGRGQLRIQEAFPTNLLLILERKEGRLPILEFASETGMEIMNFMEALRRLRDAGFASLEGSPADAEGIEAVITKAGQRLAAFAHAKGLDETRMRRP